MHLIASELAVWGYHVGREYAERYNLHYGTGFSPESAPLMEDIVNFWYHSYDMESDIFRLNNVLPSNGSGSSYWRLSHWDSMK